MSRTFNVSMSCDCCQQATATFATVFAASAQGWLQCGAYDIGPECANNVASIQKVQKMAAANQAPQPQQNSSSQSSGSSTSQNTAQTAAGVTASL